MNERLIELIGERNFNTEFQKLVAELIKLRIEETEWAEIENSDGNLKHFDVEERLNYQYILTWNAKSFWYLTKNTARFDEQDNSEWKLTGIVFDDFKIQDFQNELDVCFFDDKQEYYDKL